MVIAPKEIDQKSEVEIYVPEYLDTYEKAMYVLNNPEVYKEYLRRNNEINRKITQWRIKNNVG